MKRNVLLILLMIAAVPSFATNGYFVHGSGTASKAMAGAGSALPEDSLTSNPAGVVFVDSEYYLGVALFNPNRQYTVKGSPTGYPGTFGLATGTTKSKSEVFGMPSMAAKWSLTDRSALAVSFAARGGMNTDYRTNTFYGSSHTGVDLQQMFLNTTYAYKLAPKHSVGITGIVAYQRFEAQGLEAFAAFSNEPECLTNNAHDNSRGFGVKLGYLGEVAPGLNFGLSYSPKISMTEFDDYCGLFSSNGSFDIPSDAQIGIAYKATDTVSLLLDVERIEYSKVDSIGNHLLPNLMQAPLGANGGAGFGWDDMTAYKAGVQWKASPKWILRTGYSHANQPIPQSEVLFNILAPGVIQDHLTVGVTTPVRRGHFNFAVMYALDNTVTGSNPLEAPGAQTIELKMNEWEMEIGYSMKF